MRTEDKSLGSEKNSDREEKAINVGSKKELGWSSHCGSVMNPTSIHEGSGWIPGLAQWVQDLALQRLWCRPAAAAPIQPLAWELPYATSAARKIKKKKRAWLPVRGVQTG